jgi:hypothetical protein
VTVTENSTFQEKKKCFVPIVQLHASIKTALFRKRKKCFVPIVQLHASIEAD